jgi:hypothetical protein
LLEQVSESSPCTNPSNIPRQFIGLGTLQTRASIYTQSDIILPPIYVKPISVDALSDNDIDFKPARSTPIYVEDVPQRDTIFVTPGFPIKRKRTPMLTPVSKSALYQNLLSLLSHHPTSRSSLPNLISYHNRFPSFQSTRSYNLLISYAIRHTAFVTVTQLQRAMRSQNIPANLETWKLSIRSLIRCSRWGDAWQEVMRVIGKDSRTGRHHDEFSLVSRGSGGMPLAIWMEFFGTAKRGLNPHRGSDRNEATRRRGGFDVTQEAGDQLATDIERFKLLMNNPPNLTANQLRKIPARTVYLAVQMMLRIDQRDPAWKLTKSYLDGLPAEINDKWAHACLNIIHLYIIFEKKRGLSGYSSARKTTDSLLSMSRCLRPNSTTLFLLLRSLRRTKRCGTIAYDILKKYKRRWGMWVEDDRVRRRVAGLALKEGRIDIANAMVEGEKMVKWVREWWEMRKEVLGGRDEKRYRKLLRAPGRQMFGKMGRENWLWRLLVRRIGRATDRIRVKDN